MNRDDVYDQDADSTARALADETVRLVPLDIRAPRALIICGTWMTTVAVFAFLLGRMS